MVNFTIPLLADQQGSEQQQSGGAGGPFAPADRDTDSEADHVRGPWHREKLSGLSAGEAGTATEEPAGWSEQQLTHQHGCYGGTRSVHCRMGNSRRTDFMGLFLFLFY